MQHFLFILFPRVGPWNLCHRGVEINILQQPGGTLQSSSRAPSAELTPATSRLLVLTARHFKAFSSSCPASTLSAEELFHHAVGRLELPLWVSSPHPPVPSVCEGCRLCPFMCGVPSTLTSSRHSGGGLPFLFVVTLQRHVWGKFGR